MFQFQLESKRVINVPKNLASMSENFLIFRITELLIKNINLKLPVSENDKKQHFLHWIFRTP